LKFQKKILSDCQEDAYITISNHPLGGIDGVLLLKLVEESLILKLLLIFFYIRLPLKEYIIPVNLLKIIRMPSQAW
jgi:hypothetical protein